MPIITYINCNRTTNSATSNYWSNIEMDNKTPKEVGIATRCYAAFVDGKWIEGCAYNQIDSMTKKMIDILFAEKGV